MIVRFLLQYKGDKIRAHMHSTSTPVISPPYDSRKRRPAPYLHQREARAWPVRPRSTKSASLTAIAPVANLLFLNVTLV